MLVGAKRPPWRSRVCACFRACADRFNVVDNLDFVVLVAFMFLILSPSIKLKLVSVYRKEIMIKTLGKGNELYDK